MNIKKGVSLQGLKPEILIALMIAEQIWVDSKRELVITAGTDGKHSKTSRHYIGMAVDLRTRYFTAAVKKSVVKALKRSLGIEYIVVAHKTHIHIQYNGNQA